jgi:3-methyladenine DNA glycosylase/8-oxoguanine DNA glycosylase
MSAILTVPVQAPFPWRATLDYLSSRCTPGIETISADRYVRNTPSGPVSVEYDPAAQLLRCSGDNAADALPRIQRLFDTLHDPAPVARALESCPVLGSRIRELPGVRVPGCWEPFELCMRVILGQQVSVKAAHTLMGRLVARCPQLEANQVLRTDLTSLGLTSARLRTLHAFAERVANGAIRLNSTGPWTQTARDLGEVPGIGPWTVQYLAIRLGRDPDAFPDTDLGLLRSTAAPSSRDLRLLAETWRPYRAYAAMYLWAAH